MNKKNNRKRRFRCCLTTYDWKYVHHQNKLTQSEFLIPYPRTQLKYPPPYAYFSSILESPNQHHQI